jgi:hypothetical protein
MGKILPIGALGAILASAFMTRVAKVNKEQHHHEKE